MEGRRSFAEPGRRTGAVLAVLSLVALAHDAFAAHRVCSAVGSACSRNSQCCTKMCDASSGTCVCTAGGGSCRKPAECCAGQCLNGTCASATTSSTSTTSTTTSTTSTSTSTTSTTTIPTTTTSTTTTSTTSTSTSTTSTTTTSTSSTSTTVTSTTTTTTSTSTTIGAKCGDSLVQGSEQCDPPGSACSASSRCNASCQCQLSVCGDGVTEPTAEQCDDGVASNGASGDPCDASCQLRLMANEMAPAGGTVTTDPGGTGATPTNPVQAAVTTPDSGNVSILVTSNTGTPPSGVQFIGKEVDITAPETVPPNPLTLVFQIDASRIRAGENQQTIDVFRNGTRVPACVGNPGVAFPDPCVSQREVGNGDGDVQITVLSTAASTWTFGVELCGNLVVDPGEQCDPPGKQAQCMTGQVCNSVCQCGPPCDCCAASPSRLTFTTQVGSGNCGVAQNADGSTFKNLMCGGVYFGGGGNNVPLPVTFPDQSRSIMTVASCDHQSGKLILAATTSTDTGSPRTCTTAGCLFGAPIPAPNSVSAASSVCLINTIAQDVTGLATCVGQVTSLNVPVNTEVFLTGDLLPARPDIQPCPVCAVACEGGSNNGVSCTTNIDCPGGTCPGTTTCHGGPNDGMICTPGDSASLGAAYPTSHDCPPPPAADIGSVPDGFTLTTGTVVGTAGNQPSQPRVFCGFCRDPLSGCFDGDPDPGLCPDPNSTCDSSGSPDACCTGAGTGTCIRTAIACTANAQCPAAYPDCQQRNPGAFGPGGFLVKTITETGVPRACLATGSPQTLTLVGLYCYPPTFNSTVDTAADFPGPGAISLPGVMSLQ